MSNFNLSNLVPVSYDKVAKGTKAIKVGNQIFTFQNSMEFYKCASVAQDVVYYTVANASEYPECNGDYYQFSGTGNENVYKHESSEIYLFRHLDENMAEISSKPEASQDRKIYYQRYAWTEEGIPADGWQDIFTSDFGVSVTQQKEEAPKTWDGYKAVLTDGVYTFEGTLTEGLSYGNAYTPAVNSIYNDGATVKIDKLWNGSLIPTDGLVFHAPLDSLSGTAETGQTLEFTGNMPSVATVDGIQCLAFNNSVILSPQTSDIPSGSFPFSLCIALYIISKFSGPEAEQGVLNIGEFGETDYDAGISCYSRGNEIRGGAYWTRSLRKSMSDEELIGKWIPVVLTNDGSTFNMYINGEFVATGSANDIIPADVRIGGFENDYERFSGYLSDARIYNRVLSQDEIAVIADQFKG